MRSSAAGENLSTDDDGLNLCAESRAYMTTTGSLANTTAVVEKTVVEMEEYGTAM